MGKDWSQYYLPHLLVHAVMPMVLGPLCALVLSIPLLIVLGLLLPASLIEPATFFSGSAVIGFAARRFTELSKGAGFVFVLPLVCSLKWFGKRISESGVTATMNEVLLSIVGKGCCADSFVFMVLIWTAAGYVFGTFAASRLDRA